MRTIAEITKKVPNHEKAFIRVYLSDFGHSEWLFSHNGGNGSSNACPEIDVDTFDALRELVNDSRVVDHYESLRKPRYENGCTGDPVLVPGSFRTERNKP